MILLSDEEWDILELKDAFGSGRTSRDNVISKVHEIFDQVHFVCVRNASKHFACFCYRVVHSLGPRQYEVHIETGYSVTVTLRK